MNRLTNAAALIAGLATITIALIAYAFVGVEPPKQLGYVLLFGVAVGISISWAPAAVRSIKRGASDDHSKIILTIWLSWTALVVLAAYANLLFWLQRPKWLVDSPISLMVVVFMLIAGGYALVAPASGENTPKRERIWTITSAAIGGSLVGAIIALMTVFGLRNIFGG